MCVVRAWMEEGSTVLRAEISLTTDTSGGRPRKVVTTEAESVERIVRDWLSEVAADAEYPAEDQPS